MHDFVKKYITSLLEDILSFSFATNMWTSSVSSLSVITAQWIDEGFTLMQAGWNSMYYMLQSHMEQKQALGLFGSEYELPIGQQITVCVGPLGVLRETLSIELLLTQG